MAGIYIHIPFCKQACTYCNFHFSTNLDVAKRFYSRFIERNRIAQGIYSGRNSRNNLFWWRYAIPASITSHIRKFWNQFISHFKISQNPEITLETNPDDMDLNHLEEWKKCGHQSPEHWNSVIFLQKI